MLSLVGGQHFQKWRAVGVSAARAQRAAALDAAQNSLRALWTQSSAKKARAPKTKLASCKALAMPSLKLQRVTRSVQSRFDSASTLASLCTVIVNHKRCHPKRRRRSTMLVAAARHATLLQPARRRLAVQAVNLDAWLK